MTSARIEDYKNGRFPTEAAEMQRLEDLLVIYKSLAIKIPDDRLAKDWCYKAERIFQ